jgi:cysteinyl-tRNA synthetase
MKLELYNSLTREKREFIPQDDKRVTMYNCGPTVYSYAHIGNARAAVVADVLFRVLRHIYGEDHVVYARNLTDIDDKIIQSSIDTGTPIKEITEKYAHIYNEDLAALNCLEPTLQPKATEHMDEMIAMISTLIDAGCAYTSEGHVFFDVTTYDAYGKLSGNTLDQLRKGERVEDEEYARKKNAADFVLWKPAKDGEPFWPAPFGDGRPGWHLECSAMIEKNLGETIDIHCGGVDLKFPHHENEIAQSSCSHGGAPLAKYWVHNEFLNMAKKDGKSDKMSKSLGNVVLVHDLLKDWDGEVIRLALLKAHYRSELIWSEDLLKESKKQLDGWYRFFAPRMKNTRHSESSVKLPFVVFDDLALPTFFAKIGSIGGFAGAVTRPLEALGGKSLLRGVMDAHQKGKGYLDKDLLQAEQLHLSSETQALQTLQIFGLMQKDPDEWFKGTGKEGGLTDDEIEALITERAEVRAAKNWARADEIRDLFSAENIILEDGPPTKENSTGTTWRRD